MKAADVQHRNDRLRGLLSGAGAQPPVAEEAPAPPELSEATFELPEAAPRSRRRRRAGEQVWDEHMQRVTLWMDKEVAAAIAARAERTDTPKWEVVDRALRAYLRRPSAGDD